MLPQNEQDQVNNYNNKDKEDDKIVKIFDWIKAAKLIKEYHIQNASVGYDNATERSFNILKDGNPIKNNDCVMPWCDKANPVLIDNDRGEIICCFVLLDVDEKPNAMSQPFKEGKKMVSLRWPKHALDIINRTFLSQRYTGIQIFSNFHFKSSLLYLAIVRTCGILKYKSIIINSRIQSNINHQSIFKRIGVDIFTTL
ncbi:MAG TPA: hypothetical protein VFG45_10285 [Candidatus Nitrosocosmicus sp.]|nr:hypothetical protein [Candidatus Nitrosocosmicus sp.]